MDAETMTTANQPESSPVEPVTSVAPAPEAPTARRRFGLLDPLRAHDFRLVFSGETISMLGDQFHFVALAWLALQLTGSGLALGTVLTVAAIPRAVLVLVGGAYSDRLSPRSLMLVSNAIRAVVVGILAVLVLTGNAQLWQLYVLAVIFGIFDAFFWPALNTIVPMLTTEAQLPAANALMQGSQQLTTLVGPAIAGVLVAAVQTGPAFVIDSASFAVAAIALLMIAGGRRPRPLAGTETAPRDSILANIREGIGMAMRDPAIRTTMLLTAAFNLAFTGPILVGLPWAARDHWGGSAVFGFLVSGFGAGALVGAIFAGSIGRVRQLGLATVVIGVVLGVALAALGFVPNAAVAFVVLLLMALGVGFINVRLIAWLQARVPDTMRGRIISLVSFGSVSLTPLSLALAGVVVDVAAPAMFAVAGAIVVLASLAGAAWGLPTHMQETDGPAAPASTPAPAS
jgi:MFS family permease